MSLGMWHSEREWIPGWKLKKLNQELWIQNYQRKTVEFEVDFNSFKGLFTNTTYAMNEHFKPYHHQSKDTTYVLNAEATYPQRWGYWPK